MEMQMQRAREIAHNGTYYEERDTCTFHLEFCVCKINLFSRKRGLHVARALEP